MGEAFSLLLLANMLKNVRAEAQSRSVFNWLVMEWPAELGGPLTDDGDGGDRLGPASPER